MSGLLARRADPADLGEVLRLLNEASVWLRSKGTDQWGRGFGPERIAPLAEAGRTFLVVPVDGGPAVATVSVSPEADRDFWTGTEQLTPAWYVSKLAVDRTAAGSGLGALLLRWVLDRACSSGIPVVRLDAWRTNTALHGWYLRQGWVCLRTVDAPGRMSGALFEHAAADDLVARQTFAGRSVAEQRMMRAPLAAGDRIIADGGERGSVTVVEPPRTENGITRAAADYPMRVYWARMDSGRTAAFRDVDIEPETAGFPARS